MTKFVSVTLCCFISSVTLLTAQTPTTIQDAEISEVIDSVSRILNDNYVFPDVAREMSALLQKKREEGAFQSVTDPQIFANLLTEDLQSISNDLHLRVRFAPDQISEMRAHAESESDEIPESWLNGMRRGNFGFKEVKILDGNIGYLDLRGFMDTQYASETAVAAMNFLANADALIIDLTQNGGGSPAMIQLIASYLFDSEPVHLNNFYHRPKDEHTQTWTLPHVPGKRSPDTDVYILTSRRTFSAAEEFCYNLRNLERATLIGETTGGGAHPGGTQIATDRFTVWVPTGRAINPITETNWEGTGVEPHIHVPANEALSTAHMKALETLHDATEDEEVKFNYAWSLVNLKAKLNPITVDESLLKSYVGSYGARKLTFKNGKLYYARDGGPMQELQALENNLFTFESAPNFRLKVIQEDGKAVSLTGIYQNGRTDQSLRDDGQP